ncbi:MAG: hypothetical protein IRZ26_01180 [Clostridia bacterium]|nr:hypothetical protein [Clostridia bacterium]MCL6521084.1 hypothetical protein [Bacillota bacterium]
MIPSQLLAALAGVAGGWSNSWLLRVALRRAAAEERRDLRWIFGGFGARFAVDALFLLGTWLWTRGDAWSLVAVAAGLLAGSALGIWRMARRTAGREAMLAR